MATIALGQFLAMELAMSLIMPALTLKRSSRVIPGLRGTPAGITTTSASLIKKKDKIKFNGLLIISFNNTGQQNLKKRKPLEQTIIWKYKFLSIRI